MWNLHARNKATHIPPARPSFSLAFVYVHRVFVCDMARGYNLQLAADRPQDLWTK